MKYCCCCCCCWCCCCCCCCNSIGIQWIVMRRKMKPKDQEMEISMKSSPSIYRLAYPVSLPHTICPSHQTLCISFTFLRLSLSLSSHQTMRGREQSMIFLSLSHSHSGCCWERERACLQATFSLRVPTAAACPRSVIIRDGESGHLHFSQSLLSFLILWWLSHDMNARV